MQGKIPLDQIPSVLSALEIDASGTEELAASLATDGQNMTAEELIALVG